MGSDSHVNQATVSVRTLRLWVIGKRSSVTPKCSTQEKVCLTLHHHSNNRLQQLPASHFRLLHFSAFCLILMRCHLLFLYPPCSGRWYPIAGNFKILRLEF